MKTLYQIAMAVEAEVARAKQLFPGNDMRLLAFVEESGEVTKAMLDLKQGKCTPDDVRKEVIQCIAMAVRLLQEGDSAFPEFK